MVQSNDFFLTMDLPSPLNPFPNFCPRYYLPNLIIPLPQSNGFTESQIKTIKTSLTTAKTSGISIEHLLQTLRCTSIGPNIHSHCEIIHNYTDECPGQPSTPIDLEKVKETILLLKRSKRKTIMTKDIEPNLYLTFHPDKTFYSLVPQTRPHI